MAAAGQEDARAGAGVAGAVHAALAAPATPAPARINAGLARLDARWIAFRRQCRADGGAAHSETSRTVTVTMAGPKVVSFLVAAQSYCGGAYPNSDAIALAYDLGD